MFGESKPMVRKSLSASQGGVPVTVAGAQGYVIGLDQVSLLLPKSLAGRGEVDVTLTFDGQAANSVKVIIKESFRTFH